MISDINETFQKYDANELRLDLGGKKVLSDKYILGYILTNCVEEYIGYDFREIAQSCIEQNPLKLHPIDSGIPPRIQGLNVEDSSSGGKIIGDLFFSSLVPKAEIPYNVLIDMEPQGDFYKTYPLVKRAYYNGARRIVSQRGVQFSGSDYGHMKKVYTIWICLNSPKERQNGITEYKMIQNVVEGKEMKAKPEDYDNMRIILTSEKIYQA